MVDMPYKGPSRLHLVFFLPRLDAPYMALEEADIHSSVTAQRAVMSHHLYFDGC